MSAKPHHAMLAGGGFAVRRLIILVVMFTLIAVFLAWWVTDGFRQMNWRDLVEWRQYQIEQMEMG